jgi:hypothetical protein
MTYTEELCNALVARLQSAVTLSPPQVASYIATIAFWQNEVIHCLQLLDDYPKRFEVMKCAEREFSTRVAYEFLDTGWTYAQIDPRPPARKGLKDSEREQLRRLVVQSFLGLVNRATALKIEIPPAVLSFISDFER